MLAKILGERAAETVAAQAVKRYITNANNMTLEAVRCGRDWDVELDLDVLTDIANLCHRIAEQVEKLT